MTFKNFVSGMGSILNIFPEPPKFSEKYIADEDRIRDDVAQIGNDLYRSMDKIKSEYHIKD